MPSISSRIALGAVAVLGFALGACVVSPPPAYPPATGTTSMPSATVTGTAPIAPPPEQAEMVPPPPGPNSVWVPGRWSYNGTDWAWIGGRYETRPTSTAQWIPGHWTQQGNAWVWTSGRWTS